MALNHVTNNFPARHKPIKHSPDMFTSRIAIEISLYITSISLVRSLIFQIVNKLERQQRAAIRSPFIETHRREQYVWSYPSHNVAPETCKWLPDWQCFYHFTCKWLAIFYHSTIADTSRKRIQCIQRCERVMLYYTGCLAVMRVLWLWWLSRGCSALCRLCI